MKFPKQPTVARRKCLQAGADKPDANVDDSHIGVLSSAFWEKHHLVNGVQQAEGPSDIAH